MVLVVIVVTVMDYESSIIMLTFTEVIHAKEKYPACWQSLSQIEQLILELRYGMLKDKRPKTYNDTATWLLQHGITVTRVPDSTIKKHEYNALDKLEKCIKDYENAG